MSDLDGVIWRGARAIDGSAGAIATLRAAGARVAFLTNNSNARVRDLVARLGRFGIDADTADVLTSAQAAAAALCAELPTGARVLACAGPGVGEAVEQQGFTLVSEGPADAVIVGWHREFDFDRLDRASAAVRAGARFIATNTDPTYPGDGRLLPGAGAIVAAVATASGVVPEVAGKPEPATVELVHRRLGRRGIVIGDRPSTDGALAEALGWPFALVLSGIASRAPGPGDEPVPDPAPAFVADDLAALAGPLLRDGHIGGTGG